MAALRDDMLMADITLLRVRDGDAALPVVSHDTVLPYGIEALPLAGHTPLLRISRVLLSLAAALRDGADIDDMPVLHAKAMEAVRRFDQDASDAGIEARTTATARYVLCTMLDEAVLHVAWRDNIHWRRQTLLFVHHGDTYGGDTFFVILDRVLSDIGRHIDLAELIHVCLALGFGGRYLVEEGGKARLARQRETLHRQIVACRADPTDALSSHWQGATRPVKQQRGPRPLIVLTCTVVVVLLAWCGLRWILADLRGDTDAYLRVVTQASAPPPFVSPPVASLPTKTRPATREPSLSDVLASDPARETMDIREDEGGRTTVRLLVPGMFRSGGADLDPSQRNTLKRMAAALDRLRGEVQVVGHTDDQPIRTARYRDNIDLSSARARAVAAILVGHMTDPTRVSSHGAGDSRPVALPPDRAENRPLNRRVDIVFVPEMR